MVRYGYDNSAVPTDLPSWPTGVLKEGEKNNVHCLPK